MLPLRVVHLGQHVPYPAGMDAMREAMRAIDAEASSGGGPVLLLLEHAPTITLTRTGGETWLKKPRASIEAEGIAVCDADRGGDATFHGPGQLVGYPVTKLQKRADGHLDLVGYLHRLEAGLVAACAAMAVDEPSTIDGETGVWVGNDKLVALGVGVGHRGVTRHGFALNIDIDTAPYTDAIVPCGLEGRGVTTLREQLGARCPPTRAVEHIVADHVARALGYDGAEWAHGASPPSSDSTSLHRTAARHAHIGHGAHQDG
jgi:lipoyl(octanoyl) transferase